MLEPIAPLRTISRAFRAASRARAASSALPTIFLATVGFCSKILRQALVEKRLHGALNVGIQLAFRLTFKLRLRQFDRDYRYQAFTNIISGERSLEVLRRPEDCA